MPAYFPSKQTWLTNTGVCLQLQVLCMILVTMAGSKVGKLFLLALLAMGLATNMEKPRGAWTAGL